MNNARAVSDWPLPSGTTQWFTSVAATDDYDAVVRLAIELTDRERYLRFFTSRRTTSTTGLDR